MAVKPLTERQLEALEWIENNGPASDAEIREAGFRISSLEALLVERKVRVESRPGDPAEGAAERVWVVNT